MQKPVLLCAALVAAAIAAPSPAAAQTWTETQQAVWRVIVDSWDAIAARDVAWTDRFVHPNALAWSGDYPMPRTRASVKRWDGYEFPSSMLHLHEERLAGMVVQGNTAVAHYYYSLATEDREGERETVHGRCSDILINEGGRWQFIGWHCTDTASDDD